MPFHADLHLHSHRSRATSKNLNLEHLSKWAQIKGIRVVGTGDFVHPDWLDELEKKLEPAEEGLFRLKPEYERLTSDEVPPACRAPVRFMMTVEISNIYKRMGRVRKVHNVVFAPGFDAARRIQARLDRIGNIRADGRPILGLDSRDLLEIVLEADPLAFLIPAHIWTPWFSALGAYGGFDRIEDCFGDLTSHIFAVETGLSSDPLMNWRLSQLDPYVVVSNSDAHSPQKLGRETTLFETECSYPAIYRALSDPEDSGLVGTVEFFPEEGKYHYDGHRKCETRLHPRETTALKGLCPVCGRPVTVGVMARVEALADRPEGVKAPRWRPYWNLIPLPEIIGEARNVGSASKAVDEQFMTMLTRLGSEFHILLEAAIEDIAVIAGPLVAEGVRRMRAGQVSIAPGYDGDYGIIHLFEPEERASIGKQTSFFEDFPETKKKKTGETGPGYALEPPEEDREPEPEPVAAPSPDVSSSAAFLPDAPETWPLNSAQRQAVVHEGGHLLIVAGPGTGKTHTLTHRIAWLSRGATAPRSILAVTFTNKAAEEMRERLIRLMGDKAALMEVGTFHGVCLSLLRERAKNEGADIPVPATPDDIERLSGALWPDDTRTQRKQRLERISRWKGEGTEGAPEEAEEYTRRLREHGLMDYDDLILETLRLMTDDAAYREALQKRYRHVFVDEYQDINPAQRALLTRFVDNGVGLTAIGDPNQAIYGFRGAEPAFFHTFAADFPGARTLYLSENYRSAPVILEASSQVIGVSSSPVIPAPVATLYTRGRLTVHEAATDRAEAEYVVHQIERLVGGTSLFSRDSGRVRDGEQTGRSFGDLAALYRLNSQSLPLREALERSGIPYRITGELALIERPGVLEIVTLLRLSQGMNVSSGAARRLLESVVDGLGARALARIDAGWEARRPITRSDIEALRAGSALHGRAGAAIETLIEDMNRLREALEAGLPSPALEKIPDQTFWKTLTERHPTIEEHLKKLIRSARLAPDAAQWLDTLTLSRDYDPFGEEGERVRLMTLHASKGLEFPVVFIIGCESDLLPLQYPGMTSDLEEERRLFYVGMTRARDQLYLTRARRRSLFGHITSAYPSPFLADIEEQLKQYEKDQEKTRRSKAPPSSQLPLFGE